MGRMKEKLIELEDEGIIVYNKDENTWVLAEALPVVRPFDLAEYLFELHEKRSRCGYTQEQKETMFEYGDYHFPVPPVSTAFWTKHAWINYIDANGSWGVSDEH